MSIHFILPVFLSGVDRAAGDGPAVPAQHAALRAVGEIVIRLLPRFQHYPHPLCLDLGVGHAFGRAA